MFLLNQKLTQTRARILSASRLLAACNSPFLSHLPRRHSYSLISIPRSLAASSHHGLHGSLLRFRLELLDPETQHGKYSKTEIWNAITPTLCKPGWKGQYFSSF